MRGYPPEGAWVAVHVQSNREKKVFLALNERSYESFLPTYRALRRWSDRSAELELPLFRGYLFCRWLNHNPQQIVQVPGVIRVVGFGRMPACVDDSEIAAVRRIVDSKVVSMPWKLLRIGERVKVTSGALSGIEGILVKSSSGSYVIVNVVLLGRAVAAKIHPSQIAACDALKGRLDVVANAASSSVIG